MEIIFDAKDENGMTRDVKKLENDMDKKDDKE